MTVRADRRSTRRGSSFNELSMLGGGKRDGGQQQRSDEPVYPYGAAVTDDAPF